MLIDNVVIPLGFRQIHTARLINWKASSLPPEFREVLDSVTQLLSRVQAPVRTLAPAGLTSEVPGREQTATPVRSSVPEVSSKREPKSDRRVLPVPRFFTLVAVTVIVCAVFGMLYKAGYFRRQGIAFPNPQSSLAKQTVSETPTEPKSTPSDATGGGTAFGSLEFLWPGGDFWQIYRGEQLVTEHMGSGKQALQAGTYTIKATNGPVFSPFEVSIKSGSTTKIETGGILEFNWPGNDFWQIYRGKQLVAEHMGPGKQALQAGTYTIKATNGPVFSPFEVSIKSGSTTKIETGGILEFNWPGNDFWQIYRGEQPVAEHMGSGKQALQAGTYTIKATNGPVFSPFEVQIRDGGKTKVP